MRVLCFCNNRVGWEVLRFLRAQGEEIAGVVMHPRDKQKFGPEITAAAAGCAFLDASRLGQPETLEFIRGRKPEVGVSAYFGYLLKPPVLDLLPLGCINLHPALLPYNRGAHPNVWSIVEGTPAGVTLHYIDEGVDTGDILAQRPVAVEITDTGETLYRKLERASIDLFEQTWPDVRARRAPGTPQAKGAGGFHRVSELDGIAEIELDAAVPARRLLDLIRAQTFPPHRGAWFRHNGRKVYVRLSLFEEESETHAGSPSYRN